MSNRDQEMEECEVVVDRIRKEPWHLSKSVPLSLLLALFVQTIIVAGAWFTHKTDFENFKDQTQLNFVAIKTSMDDRYRRSQAASDFALRDERIATLKASLEILSKGVSDLDRSLDDKFDRLSELIREERRMTHQTDKQAQR